MRFRSESRGTSTGREGEEEEITAMSILSMPEILPPVSCLELLGEEAVGSVLPGAMDREAECMLTQRRGSRFHRHTQACAWAGHA